MDKDFFRVVKAGGVTTPSGFRACGIHAGFRKNPERLDFALVEAECPAQCVGMFTQNKFCAAPVLFNRSQLGKSGVAKIRAIAINSGNANAATGSRGYEVVEKSADIVAGEVGCERAQVLICSTGVIGVQLPLEPYEKSASVAAQALSREGGRNAARAILTTDTVEKEVAVEIDGETLGLDGVFHIGGMVKGSGMIQPNMATMIAIITTDIPLFEQAQKTAFKHAVDRSFNCVTIDSDTSTNDTAILMSSGSGDNLVEEGSEAFEKFSRALDYVCIELAKKIAMDGEGATKVVQVSVQGAKSDEEADDAAREVANSPLVKTAIAGRDANWGRIAAALGKSDADFVQEDVDIDFIGMPVLRNGLPVDFDEDEALKRFNNSQIDIDIKLGGGCGKAIIWTCDLTHDYISINADYRS